MGRPTRPAKREQRPSGTVSKYRDKKARNGVQPKEGYGAIVPVPTLPKFVPMNPRQKLYYNTIKAKTCTFATGFPGTAKSYIAIVVGVEHLLSHPEAQLILSNPAVEIGPKLGTLPGDKDEKLAVSVRPMRDILHKLLGASHVEYLQSRGRIQFEPLSAILGNTYDNALMVLDEAQNATPGQMKAFLTRLGQRSKVVICGDYVNQTFIHGQSGLEDALKRFPPSDLVGHVNFTENDIVRSEWCKAAILAYCDKDRIVLDDSSDLR